MTSKIDGRRNILTICAALDSYRACALFNVETFNQLSAERLKMAALGCKWHNDMLEKNQSCLQRTDGQMQ